MTKQEYLYNWTVEYFIPVVHLIIAIEDYKDKTSEDPYIILHKRYLDAESIFDTLMEKVEDETPNYTEHDMNAALSTYITTVYNEEIKLLLQDFQKTVDKNSPIKYDVYYNYIRFFEKNSENAAVNMIKHLREEEETAVI